MRPNAVLAASARRAAELVLAMLLGASPALAGDRALFDPIGFSADGRYFAFEEFGVQDGSGFAYSNIYVVDLPANAWTPGTPYHAQASGDDPDQPLAAVRAEALAAAHDQLQGIGATVPAAILALVGDGVGGAAKSLSWAMPSCCGPGETEADDHRLSLETFPTGSPRDCESFTGERALGYALTYTATGVQRVLHRDGATLPASRGCPLDYRMYAVLAPFAAAAPRVAIVSVYPFGFEGPDRRFLAEPIDR